MHAQRPPEPTAIEGGSDAGAVPLRALRSTGLPRFRFDLAPVTSPAMSRREPARPTTRYSESALGTTAFVASQSNGPLAEELPNTSPAGRPAPPPCRRRQGDR